MNYFNKYCFSTIAGILKSTGADLRSALVPPNLFSLHNFATRNATYVRRAPRSNFRSIGYHRSRATIKY